ncbi:helix-turn-helix domain-containing protein [Desulfonatronum thiodismutans]|uniref:helix-turn-helix domain-containing protein n=1 Tax=Desulfonatronum thiodismutans TaxID=159290 RepID=UPI0004ABE2E8|nr:helix-turn-helix transcriptional regulator [Desulfonatronum thiodismutans]
MLEHTKRPHTETVEVVFRGPADHLGEASKAMAGFGFERADQSRPWRESFPDLTEQTLPGVCLRAARIREGVTQAKLASVTGIPQRHISEMENGKRPIGKKSAQIFANALNMDYRIFM